MIVETWGARAAAASSDAAGIQPDEGGPQPTPLLQLFDLGAPSWADRYAVRPISQNTAAHWCAQYHYSGNAGPENGAFWGFYLGDLACVVGFGIGANQFGLARKFDLERWPGNIEICRVAAHPSAPRNTASRAVAAVLRTAQAPVGRSWVYSYADTGQGHHGGIYQALRAVYVGLVPAIHGWMLDGLPVHPRTIVDLFGTQAQEAAPLIARERGRDLVYVPGLNTPKHTYILPIGPSADDVRAHLERFRRPYPKRGPGVTAPDTAAAWPRAKSPAVGDTVELGTTRYRITGFHQTDEGMLARLVPTGGATFAMAHELRVGGDGVWRAETEGEAREAWGK